MIAYQQWPLRGTCDPQSNLDNEVIYKPTALIFGGFAPGIFPHVMYANGNIKAFELNMPTNDIQFLKLAKQLQDQLNEAVDLSDIVPAYSYLGAWHQPTIFVELLFNIDMWKELSDGERALIEAVGRSITVKVKHAAEVVGGDQRVELFESSLDTQSLPDLTEPECCLYPHQIEHDQRS